MRVSVHLIVVALLLGFGVLSAWAYLYTPSMIAAGCFHTVAHKGSGSAFLYNYRDGRLMLALRTCATPCARISRCTSSMRPIPSMTTPVRNSRAVFLGPLNSPAADQVCGVPAGVALAHRNAVVIWSEKCRVNSTTAPLR